VKDGGIVTAEREDGARQPGQFKLDGLQLATVEIIANCIAQGHVKKRAEFAVLGTHLYQALFGDRKVEDFFKSAHHEVAEGSRLRIQLSFEGDHAHLTRLPWEYLYYPEIDRFFATEYRLVLSRYKSLATGRAETLNSGETPLRILIVASKPKNLGPVLEEPVKEAIEKLSERYPITITTLIDDPATVYNFKQTLKETKPHVLHFIGHGRFDAEEKRGEIALIETYGENAAWVPDLTFAELFDQVQPVPLLVFLHLCEGAMVDADSKRSLIKFSADYAGLAPRLIDAKVQAVIAMQHPIKNDAAILFGRAFYEALFQGKNVDEAVQDARTALAQDNRIGYDNRVFGTPVLYMRSRSGLIFNLMINAQTQPVTQATSVVAQQIPTPVAASASPSQVPVLSPPATSLLEKDVVQDVPLSPLVEGTGAKSRKPSLANCFIAASAEIEKMEGVDKARKDEMRKLLFELKIQLDKAEIEDRQDIVTNKFLEEASEDFRTILGLVLEAVKK
jgi:hypothetical protein